jgi:hypothetical protein
VDHGVGADEHDEAAQVVGGEDSVGGGWGGGSWGGGWGGPWSMVMTWHGEHYGDVEPSLVAAYKRDSSCSRSEQDGLHGLRPRRERCIYEGSAYHARPLAELRTASLACVVLWCARERDARFAARTCLSGQLNEACLFRRVLVQPYR